MMIMHQQHVAVPGDVIVLNLAQVLLLCLPRAMPNSTRLLTGPSMDRQAGPTCLTNHFEQLKESCALYHALHKAFSDIG